jgi:serine/threonine-protein kinase
VTTAAATAPLVIGRYALFDELAAGGMATVHLGRLLGPVGFGRTVAIKRLHAHYLKDEEFITMFMDEARIVARIRHPNVVPMVDVVQNDNGLFLIMEYVHGESLSRLMRTARKLNEPVPPRIVAAIMSGVLLGLHAAHESKGNDGELLNVVHRDVSPQNVIVGADGSARVLDFGIAKAAGRAQVTREGQIKGKLAYMAPEQIRGQVDRRTDVFAAAVVLWEMLAGKRLHGNAKDVDIVTRIMQGNLPRPSSHAPEVTPELDEIVMRGLASDPKKRIGSARDLALELEKKVGLATPSEVAEWVEHHAQDVLEARSNLVTAMELAAGDLLPVETNPPPAFGMTPNDPIPTGNIPVHLDPAHATSTTSSHEVPSSSAVFAHAQASERSGFTNADDVLPRELRSSAKMDRATLTVIVVSSLMALIGLILGAYALTHRSPPPERKTEPSAPAVGTSGAGGAGTSGAGTSATTSKPDDKAPATATGTAAANGDTKDVAPTATTAATAGASAAAAGGTARPADTAATSVASSAVPAANPTALPTGTSALPTGTSAPPTGTSAPATGTSATNGAGAKPATTLPAPGGAATVRKPGGKPSCDPPYTVDDVGHRHYKPECMGLE